MLVLGNMYRDLIQVGRALGATHFVVFFIFFHIDFRHDSFRVMMPVPAAFGIFFASFCSSLYSYSVLMGHDGMLLPVA